VRAARGLAAAACLALLGAAAPGRVAAKDCGASAELEFVCGAERPEDLAPIPGSRWLIASGVSPGAGLKLVDTGAKSLERWYDGGPGQVDFDRAAFPYCPGPPDAALLTPRGLSLRARGRGRYRLLAVNHGGRESVEVFDVDAGGAAPRIAWRGCLPMPEGHVGNSVAAWSDGTVLVTVLTRPGTTIADFLRGRRTGAVFEWRPGDDRFRLVRGTEMPGANGLETSPDDRFLYVVAFGWHSILVFDRRNMREPAKTILAPDFMPDNIHWSEGRLLTAGMRLREPACGGLRRIVGGVADPMACHRGYVVAELDRASGRLAKLVDSGPDPLFNGVSTAAIAGANLWLGSYQADRIAWRRLPRGKESG
jgi:hypothetical protein